MEPFDSVAAALAALFSTDVTAAGLLLGFIVIVVLVIAFGWALGDTVGSSGMFIGGGIAVVFVSLVGWWPLWTVIFIGLLLVFIIINPWGGRGVLS